MRRLRLRPKFYEEEDKHYTGRWQKRMSVPRAMAFLIRLARRAGERMPIVVLEPTGPYHAADRKHMWIMADDLTPITLCHEFAHVIQCRNLARGTHDMHFATLVCLMTELAS